MRVAFDMETRDPDDGLALCWLAGNPAIELALVTVTPGTPAQVGVVKRLLDRVGRPEVPVGSRDPRSPAQAVSEFHYQWLGSVDARDPDGIAHELLAQCFARPDTVLVTGAPLQNLRLLLQHHPTARITRWIAQGGFAGDNLVPPHLRLAKFSGRTTCESFNLGGDKKGARIALESSQIARRELVSKNVTHGLAWDAAFHARAIAANAPGPGARLMIEAMTLYLQQHPEGKLLHDPLAACCALDPTIVTWREITVTYAEGRWGSEPAEGTGTFISIDVDRARFFEMLLA